MLHFLIIITCPLAAQIDATIPKDCGLKFNELK